MPLLDELPVPTVPVHAKTVDLIANIPGTAEFQELMKYFTNYTSRSLTLELSPNLGDGRGQAAAG